MTSIEISAKTTVSYSVNQNTAKKNGLVQDENDTPLIGVNVVIKGTTIGVVSNIDGKFSLNAKNGDILVLSYIGHVTREVKVSDQSMSITLSENRQLLDEVIVIGYGTTTRKSAVGAVDQVKKEMLENRPVTNITQALQGAAPNLIIQTREFDPADYCRRCYCSRFR